MDHSNPASNTEAEYDNSSDYAALNHWEEPAPQDYPASNAEAIYDLSSDYAVLKHWEEPAPQDGAQNDPGVHGVVPTTNSVTYYDDWENSLRDIAGNLPGIKEDANETDSDQSNDNDDANQHTNPTESVQLQPQHKPPPNSVFAGSIKSFHAYIFGDYQIDVPANERICIVRKDDDYFYEPNTVSLSAHIGSPHKQRKLMGMKGFISYKIITSNGTEVDRRYKHFDWLHKRLHAKYSLTPIPPLPDKKLFGNQNLQFIECRRAQLQEFLNWMCRHPVLRNSTVFKHFLECKDVKRWKWGKRTAEQDPIVGPLQCATFSLQQYQYFAPSSENKIEHHRKFVETLGRLVNQMYYISHDHVKCYQIQSKTNYSNFARVLSEMCTVLQNDEREGCHVNLSYYFDQASSAYKEITRMIDQQPSNDFIPFANRLHIYRGICGYFSSAVNLHKNAVDKRKEFHRLKRDGKIDNDQLKGINDRVDKVSLAILAECNYMREERNDNLKHALKHLIDEQIKFHRTIVERLEMVQTLFRTD